MKLSLCQLLLFILVSMHYVRGHGIRIPLSKPGGDFFYNRSPFYGPISIGTPPQNFNVCFDTNDSYELWIYTSFMNSSSFRVPGHSYYNHNTSYTHRCLEKCEVGINGIGGAVVKGFWAIDTITMDNVQITNQKFYAVRNRISDFEVRPHDGCVGLEYKPSTLEDHIISQICKQLEADSKFSLHFTNELQGTQGGELTLCEVNETKFRGELNYVNETIPGFWRISVDKISLGYGNQRNQEIAVKAEAWIYTNTPFIKGPLEDIEKIFRGINITNSKKIQTPQEVDCDTIHELPNILFRIRGQDYTFTGYDYILERLNDNKRVCIVGLLDSDYAQTWFFGELFLRKFYTVFDMEKHRIGFAESKYYTSRPRQA